MFFNDEDDIYETEYEKHHREVKDLKVEILAIKVKENYEKAMRDTFPDLKEAYDRYQILLALRR